jgi:hypothetical protein
MNMPGFTAEAALDAARTHYRTVESVAHTEGDLRLAFLPGTCFQRCLRSCEDDPFCYHNCRCICYGHPGKTCFPI